MILEYIRDQASKINSKIGWDNYITLSLTWSYFLNETEDVFTTSLDLDEPGFIFSLFGLLLTNSVRFCLPPILCLYLEEFCSLSMSLSESCCLSLRFEESCLFELRRVSCSSSSECSLSKLFWVPFETYEASSVISSSSKVKGWRNFRN